MKTPSPISFLSLVYFAFHPLIVIFINVYAHVGKHSNLINQDKKGNSTNQLNVNWNENLMIGVFINQIVIFIIGKVMSRERPGQSWNKILILVKAKLDNKNCQQANP